MLFKHSHTKYTVSIISKVNPRWHDVKQTKYRWVAQTAYNKLKKTIDPKTTHIAITKFTVYGCGCMCASEEIECMGTSVSEIARGW